jgi:hypothetical protein
LAKKPETVFKDRIRPKLKAIPNSWWEKIQQVVIRGTPDFIGVINGVFIALELKKDENENPEPLQLHKLKLIERAGGKAYVVSPENWESVYQELLELSVK